MRTALLAIRSEIFGSESKGQVGGVEGSAELRREYARVSLQWTCRECGVSNGNVMKDWWGVCMEKGVEVDVEGFEGNGPSGDGEQQAGTADAAVDMERQAEPVASAMTTATTSAPLESEPQIQPQVAAPVEATQSTTAAASAAAPPSTVSTQSSAPQITALQSRPVPATAAIAQASEPANSPWLDRAIVVVVFALIILILRQTLDVEDL